MQKHTIITGNQHTLINSEDKKILNELKLSKEIFSEFWDKFNKNWSTNKTSILSGSKVPLTNIISYIPKQIEKHIDLQITFNEINHMYIGGKFEGFIEIYISPRGNKNNVSVMKGLYNQRIKLPNLLISCYRCYNKMDILIKDINYNNFTVSYDDFGYQSQLGFENLPDGKNKPLLHLVICVKEKIVNKILKKQKINFKKSSRNVWIPNSNTIEILLENIIGEYNMVNHIGYIEFLPETEISKLEETKFLELGDLKKEMDLIHKSYKYRSCNFCEHLELQTYLFKCTGCKLVYYCCKECQKYDWVSHKIICKNK
jgi:hypothetical protein